MAAIIDYRGKSPSKTTWGIPLVTAKIVKGGRIEPPNEFIAEKDYDFWMQRGLPQKGDVVMTTEAPLGEVAQLDGSKVALAQRVITLRGKPDLLDNTFLKYLLQSQAVQEELHSRATGTTVFGIRQSELRKVPLTLPPLPEQEAVAQILGTLDGKIEANRRMNATLEAMARALFQSWFVDFDPVFAKTAGRQPSCMDAATAALFPSAFQASALGEIPKGWNIRPLSELCSYLSRGIGPVYFERGGVLVLNQKCIRDHHVNYDLGRRHNDQKKPISGRQLEKLDVLVNSTGVGTLGRVAQVFDVPEPMIVDSHVTIVRADSAIDPYFVGVNLTGREAEVEALGEGSTGQTELSRVRLGALPILTPSFELQSTFGKIVRPLFERIAVNENQSRTLTTLRDTLLPRLLSGEVAVAGLPKEVKSQ